LTILLFPAENLQSFEPKPLSLPAEAPKNRLRFLNLEFRENFGFKQNSQAFKSLVI
jgi:hypothetical protein